MRTLKTQEGDFGSNFSIIPSDQYQYDIRLQMLLTEARFGDIDKINEIAGKLERDVKNDRDLQKHSHRPDQLVLFWVYLTKMRCAAVCSNEELWVQARDNVARTIDNSPMRGHLEYQRRRTNTGCCFGRKVNDIQKEQSHQRITYHLSQVEIEHGEDFKSKEPAIRKQERPRKNHCGN